MSYKKLAILAGVLLSLTIGYGQAIPAYARARFVDQYLPAAMSANITLATNTQFNYRGKMLPTVVLDSVKVGQANALSCTLDFDAPIIYPFVFASASTVTTKMLLMQDYQDGTPRAADLCVSGDSFIWYAPVAARRFIFTVASADTPCALYVYGHAAKLK